MIDEGLLAGPVILPQHHIQMPGPIAVLLAEPTVVGSVPMLLDELLPEQLQGDALVGLQLPVNPREIGLRLGRLTAFGWGWGRREQQPLQLRVIQRRRQRPAKVGDGGPFQVALHGAPADLARVRDLSLAQMSFVVKSKNFFDLTHR